MLMGGDGVWKVGSGNWDDVSNWIGSVPDSTGDVATIPDDLVARRISLNLSTAITIGTLESFHDDEVRIRGSGDVTFSGGENRPGRLIVGPNGSLVLDVPLMVDDSDDLLADVAGGSHLELSKRMSGGGTLVKTGQGELAISGESSQWAGPFDIQNGILRVTEVDLLGSGNAGITVRGGSRLEIETNVGAPVVVLESLTLDGGIVTLGAPASTDTVTFTGPIQLESDSTFQEATELRRIYFHGPISGDGGLSIISQPRQSQPKVFELGGNNSYRGTTIINTGHFLASRTSLQVTSATGLGDVNGPTILQSGSLFLAEGSEESFIVEAGGLLSPSPSSSPYSGEISIRGGVLHAASRSFDNEEDVTVEVTGPIRVVGGAQFGRAPYAGNPLLVSGDIAGHGSLLIENGELQTFAGSVVTQGDVTVGNRAVVEFSAGFAPAGDLRIMGEPSRSSVTWTESVEGFDGNVSVRSGSLTVLADSRLGDLRIDKRSRQSRPDLVRAGVTIAPAATLTIDGALQFVAGSLAGNIAGPMEIVKTSRFDATLGGLSGFAGDVRVENGAPLIGAQGLGAPGGLNTVLAHRNANFSINTGVRIDEDINLNDSSGFYFKGSLVGDGELAGDVYLGNEGSYMGGRPYAIDPDDVPPGNLEISGAVHGGTLYKGQGSTSLTLSGDGHTYTGATHVIDGELQLSGSARLAETNEIIVRDGQPNIGQFATLTLNNSSSGRNDRVADSIPLRLRGGRLQMLGGDGVAVEESLGLVTAEDGLVSINSVAGASGIGYTTLQIDNLDRRRGSIVQFNVEQRGTIELPNVTLEDGLIGGWAIVGRETTIVDFATLNTTGVVLPYANIHSYHTDPNTAGEHDNLSIIDDINLTSDLHINALRLDRHHDIDLGNRSITVESGGVLATDGVVSISNGSLSSGSGTPSELTLMAFSGRVNVDANIVDGVGGNSDFHVAGTGEVHLSGKNTYSGTTTVSRSAWVHVERESALPADGDIVLNAGRLIIEHNDATLMDVGHLVIRQNGIIEGSTTMELDADSYELYSGRIELPLTGFGVLQKRGEGEFDLYSQNPSYGGQIVVEQGTLNVGDDAFLGSGIATEANATIVQKGGVLLTRGDIFEELLILEGGTLRGTRGTYDGPIEVRQQSTVEAVDRTDYALSGPITGSANLVLDGPLDDTKRLIVAAALDEFEGDALVRGGNVEFATDNRNYKGNVIVSALELKVGHPYALGSGATTVTPDGTLVAEGSVHARIEMAGGAFRGALRSATLTQPVTVTANSTIETPFLDITPPSLIAVNFDATVDLADNVNLKQVGPGSVRFRDEILVHGQAKLTAFDGRMDLDGTVVAAAPTATLDLVGTNTINLRGSVQVPNGNSFQLLRNGSPAPLIIRGSATLEGDGTVLNDVQIGLGGAIQPGAAVGALTSTGQVSLESAGVYHWGINDSLGLEGAPAGNGWDLILADRIHITAVEDEPFVVKINGLNADDQLGSVANFDPATQYQWSLIRSSEIIGFTERLAVDTSSFTAGNPAARFGTFSIVADDGDLLLDYRPVSGPPDFDQDLDVDADDIDLLFANLGSPDPYFDLDHDGDVDREDADELILSGFGTQYGDANLDYAVDAADFAIWNANNFGENTGWATADFNGDGNTDASDFNLWLDNRGFLGLASSVPEPSGWTLLAALLMGLLRPINELRRARMCHATSALP